MRIVEKCFIAVLLFLHPYSYAQSPTDSASFNNVKYEYLYGSDTINTSEFYKRVIAIPPTINKKRYKAVAIGSGILWTGTLGFLNTAWYSNYSKSKFHLYDDRGEWQHVDKVGHVYSAYLGTKLFYTFFRWTGLQEKKSVVWGAVGGFAYQGIIEILDGYSAKWGFSWSDIGANALGCGLYSGQQLLWHDQRIKIKYSWHIKDYKEVELLRRANNLYGQSVPERIFKDYNAQTYWLSANIKSFVPKSRWPKWLNIAVGYGANNMYGGYENTWTDEDNIAHNRTDITRYRQFFVSPDIDFSKLPWKSKFAKDFFKIVNLKMPFPSVEYNTLGQWKVNAIHF
jgi:hypothetical protein